ncbi:hypothetical protein F5Y15DRAFT_404413 [Xylariaceae sp. FL0016]|nr:hypothetical protein F5Y15DRAFT_404413 [Xylariaceae sp. FL0016]
MRRSTAWLGAVLRARVVAVALTPQKPSANSEPFAQSAGTPTLSLLSLSRRGRERAFRVMLSQTKGLCCEIQRE